MSKLFVKQEEDVDSGLRRDTVGLVQLSEFQKIKAGLITELKPTNPLPKKEKRRTLKRNDKLLSFDADEDVTGISCT